MTTSTEAFKIYRADIERSERIRERDVQEAIGALCRAKRQAQADHEARVLAARERYVERMRTAGQESCEGCNILHVLKYPADEIAEAHATARNRGVEIAHANGNERPARDMAL